MADTFPRVVINTSHTHTHNNKKKTVQSKKYISYSDLVNVNVLFLSVIIGKIVSFILAITEIKLISFSFILVKCKIIEPTSWKVGALLFVASSFINLTH